jgi:phospholipase/carboxylesterase
MHETHQVTRSKTKPSRPPALEIGEALFSTEASEVTYSVFAPLHYEAKYPYPLIIWLHNEGTDERQLMRIMPLVSIRNYVAAAPRGLAMSPSPSAVPSCDAMGADGPAHADLAAGATQSAADCDGNESDGGNTAEADSRAPAFHWRQTPEHIRAAEHRVFETIEAVRRRFHVSPSRVFLAGFSCGGTMAFRIAMQQPDRFAGVLSLDGPFPTGQAPLGRLSEIRNLPVFLAVGRDSMAYPSPLVCEHLRLFHAAGISVTLRQYPCAHQLAPQMLRDMDRWIIEQVTSSGRTNDDQV